jgi:DNA-binding response OmpR family regulator
MNGAISLFDSEHPDLVLSDITLPASNGFEIARHVHHKSPATPVVLMTAFHTAHIASEGRAAGAVAHIRKPFANKELIAVIKSLLLNHDGH